jgi:RNA polymerase sigma factor (sigma-70 family)
MQHQALVDPTIEAAAPEVAAPGRKTADLPLLIRYLQEIGQTDLLSREDEERLGRAFGEARESLVRRFEALPDGVRDFVTAGIDLARPAAEWTYEELDRCCGRLEAAGRGSSSFALARQRRSVQRAKARLDLARESLVRANLKLVTHVAKDYSRARTPDLDLIQEGNIGLMRAVEKYEVERGFRFSTYAYWWIRQAIGRSLSDHSRTIRLPVHLGRKMRKVQKAALELSDRLGRDPTRNELSAATELPRSSIDEVLRVAFGY